LARRPATIAAQGTARRIMKTPRLLAIAGQHNLEYTVLWQATGEFPAAGRF